MPVRSPRSDTVRSGWTPVAPFSRRGAARVLRVLRVLGVCASASVVGGSATAQSPLPPAASPAYGQAVIEVRYREAADVFEMLDQVSAWWPDYVEPAYRQSWIDARRLEPGDSTYFARYAQLRARHVDRTSEAGGGRRDGSGLFTAAATATADPVAAAFYQSDSLAEAFGRLRRVLSPREITFLKAFYAHFDARTKPLAAATRAATDASRAATAAALADTAVVRYVARVAALFSPPPNDSAGRRPDDRGARGTPAAVVPSHAPTAGRAEDDAGSSVPLVVLYVTWPDSMRTFATPNGRALLLRVRPRDGETVNSADVVVHEAVHVFAAGMPEAQKAALTNILLDGCAVPEAVRRLAVLEEPIATALGNIEFRRRFMPQRFAWGRRWYGDAWVDVYARLLHPLLVDRTATGRPLDVAFAREATGLCTALVGLGAGAR